MTEYNIRGKITNTDNNEMLATLTYLKDNFASSIKYAEATGDTKEVQFLLIDLNYDSAIGHITSLLTEYNDRFIDWNLTYQKQELE